MENGSGGNIGAGDAAVLALLADTSRAGRGGYWGGEGGYGAYGPYASVATLQHGIQNLGQTNRDQTDALREQFANQNLVATLAAINGNISGSEGRVVDRLRDSELNALRESSDLGRQLAACCCEMQKGFLEQSLKQQECCCETQKVVLEDGAKTRELIASQALRAAESQNNINATVGPIVAAIQATCGGHHHGPR
jgi:hypothetical protein